MCPYDAPPFGLEDEAKMQICNFCLDRWTQNKRPICVAACPTRALDAGPLSALRTKYGDVREAECFRYSESVGPSVTFKPKIYVFKNSGSKKGK
jgi:anaerobic dimethyl sulfoxide reductase subunit B